MFFPSSGRFLVRSWFRMSGHNPLLRLEQQVAEADQIIEYLKQQVQLLKEKASKRINICEYIVLIWPLFPSLANSLKNL